MGKENNELRKTSENPPEVNERMVLEGRVYRKVNIFGVPKEEVRYHLQAPHSKDTPTIPESNNPAGVEIPEGNPSEVKRVNNRTNDLTDMTQLK